VFLSLEQFGERAGIAYSTMQKYSHEKKLPQPDAVIGEGRHRPTPGWTEATVDQWRANRVGRGKWERKPKAEK